MEQQVDGHSLLERRVETSKKAIRADGIYLLVERQIRASVSKKEIKDKKMLDLLWTSFNGTSNH